MKKLYRLTQSGVDELKAERDGLVAERAPLADRIRQARELGDLSENAEYQTAREDQDRVEARISELEHILASVQIIQKPKSNGNIKLGSTVKLKADSGKSHETQVVGTMEANPAVGKISDESPIGKALLGKKVGERVELKTPKGASYYTIVAIS